MAKHEFGIMDVAPTMGKRYDSYESEKYHCISVDDRYVEEMLQDLLFDSFSHTTDNPMKGLNYCGITLIPPSSLGELISVVKSIGALADLRALLERARSENKYVIHYGL